jgi:hypothetical protein
MPAHQTGALGNQCSGLQALQIRPQPGGDFIQQLANGIHHIRWHLLHPVSRNKPCRHSAPEQKCSGALSIKYQCAATLPPLVND